MGLSVCHMNRSLCNSKEIQTMKWKSLKNQLNSVKELIFLKKKFDTQRPKGKVNIKISDYH